jgi:hypothetical protein
VHNIPSRLRTWSCADRKFDRERQRGREEEVVKKRRERREGKEK